MPKPPSLGAPAPDEPQDISCESINAERARLLAERDDLKSPLRSSSMTEAQRDAELTLGFIAAVVASLGGLELAHVFHEPFSVRIGMLAGLLSSALVGLVVIAYHTPKSTRGDATSAFAATVQSF